MNYNYHQRKNVKIHNKDTKYKNKFIYGTSNIQNAVGNKLCT